MSGYSLLRRDRRIGVHGGVAAFIKSTFSHETVAYSWDDQLEVLAFKIYGPREIQLVIILVYRPPSQEFSQASSMILVGNFNAPNIYWKDMTTSSRESSFDARLHPFAWTTSSCNIPYWQLDQF